MEWRSCGRRKALWRKEEWRVELKMRRSEGVTKVEEKRAGERRTEGRKVEVRSSMTRMRNPFVSRAAF